MELLAHVWGSEESLEGMNAFLEGRKPDFQKFRMRNKRELDEYLDGCERRTSTRRRRCARSRSRDDRSATGPMAGMRVLDLTRILAGPLCTMMLGDMGADVIKVEPPGTGDDTRGWGPPFADGEAAYFLGVNRNKRSITLNMAAPAGQKMLAGLIAKADVLIDNFKLGTLDKWGFTDAWFEQNAPRLVRCSITGYGSSGPKAALPGYDFILQAESGLMSICGEPDGGPTKYGVAIVDVCTGMLACNSILAALNARAPHRQGPEGRGVALRDRRSRCWSTSRRTFWCPARAAAGSATAIRASCPTRPIRRPTP